MLSESLKVIGKKRKGVRAKTIFMDFFTAIP
jgi:hypothetical protein